MLKAAATLSGIVRSAGGEPVSGATVSAWPSDWRRMAGDDQRDFLLNELESGRMLSDAFLAATDEAGRFDLPMLAPELHDLVAQRQGFSRAVVLARAPGDTVEIVFSQGRDVRVTLLDAHDQTVAGVDVVLDPGDPPRAAPTIGAATPSYSPSPLDLLAPAVRVQQTSEDGVAIFPHVEPGDYVVSAAAVGAPTATRRLRVTDQVIDTELRIVNGAQLSGRIVDEMGDAVSDARIWIDLSTEAGWIWWGETEIDLPPFAETRSDVDGSFVFEALAKGTYTVGVSHTDFVANESRLDVGVAGEPIVLRRGTSVHGRVLDALDGAPVSDASVVLFDKRGRPLPEKSATTAGDGTFEIVSVDKAGSGVGVRHRDYASQTKVYFSDESPRTGVTIELRRAVPIEGIVLNAEGELEAGARVEVTGSDRGLLATTDATGRFLLPLQSAEGDSIELVARGVDGAVGTSGPHQLADGSWPDVTITLGPSVRITGRVVDSDERAISAALVEARSPGGSYQASSDTEGRYRLDRLIPRNLHVHG